jgi:CheY-like chemotaxis protein
MVLETREERESDVPDESVTKKLSEAITRTLPFLRRYARAVSGSQQRGDEWVRLCAEVAVRQPELIAKVADTKLSVFKLFHSLQQPFGGLDRASAGAESVSSRLKESLTDMAPLQRQVLLLTVLEGFTVGDAAEILGIDVEAAERSLEEARLELRRVASVRVLVIEDEAIIALDVADIVRNAGHEVVGIAATEKAAVELARKHSPHLVLADIQLRGADSGISAVNEIMRAMTVPVIFVTGFPERLLTGKRVEPAFVISKPFDPDLLRAAIAQALHTVAI